MAGFVSVVHSQDDDIFSGPQVGEPIPSFTMKLGYGDSVGKEVDVVESAGENSIVVIFVHKRTRPSFALANAIMKYCKRDGGESLTCGTCMLTADPTATEKWLGQVQKYFPPGMSVGYSMDGIEGPGAFGLNRNVEMTILVGKRDGEELNVTANFALVQPGVHADGPAILKAIAEATGSKKKIDINDYLQNNQRNQDVRIAIDPRLKKQIQIIAKPKSTVEEIGQAIVAIEELIKDKKPLQQQLGSRIRPWVRNGKIDSIGSEDQQATFRKWAKEYGNRMNRRQVNRDAPARDGRKPGRANRFPKLTTLLRAVIQKDASEEQVDAAAKAVDEFISGHPGAEKEIGRIANTVVDAGKLANYGTEHAQTIISAWAKKYPKD